MSPSLVGHVGFDRAGDGESWHLAHEFFPNPGNVFVGVPRMSSDVEVGASNGHPDAEAANESEAPPYKCKWLQPMMAGDLKREASAMSREWIIESLIAAKSTTIFASYPKVGKSTFLWPAIVAVSQGRPFMGLATRQTPVLVLSEEPGDVVQERLETHGCVENDPYLMVHLLPKNIDQDALDDIRAWMKATHGLLIVDTVAEYAGIEDDSNNAEIARKLLPLKRLQRELKGTLVYIHHDRKNGEDADEGKMIRGGGEYLGIVDQAYMMSRTGGVDSRRRVIRSIGRYRTIPPRIEIEWDGHTTFDLVSADMKATGPAKTSAEVKLWKAIPAAPDEGLTRANLAALAGIHPQTAHNSLAAWERSGLLISVGAGTKTDPKRYARGLKHSSVSPLPGIRADLLTNKDSDSEGGSGFINKPALTPVAPFTDDSSVPTGASFQNHPLLAGLGGD